MIIAGIGTALGLVLVVVIVIFAFKMKGEFHDWRMQQAVADSARQQGVLDAVLGRLALLDQNAARTRTVFVQARDQQSKVPIVTGGGKKADSIANAAVNACFEKATKALTACEVARKTADSVPALKDSLTATRLKLQGLRAPPRWNAKVGAFYAWPIKKPVARIESEFKVPLLPLNATAGVDYTLVGSPTTLLDSAIKKHPWRGYIGASIPFR